MLKMNQSAISSAHVDPTFKTCSNCEKSWERLEEFIQDPAIELTGYMPTFDDLLTGLFLFNHGCGTTLACPVALFNHLLRRAGLSDPENGWAGMPGPCLNKTDFTPCPAKCNCAFVRETLLILKRWPKPRGRLTARW
jgi:hypothetical protein